MLQPQRSVGCKCKSVLLAGWQTSFCSLAFSRFLTGGGHIPHCRFKGHVTPAPSFPQIVTNTDVETNRMHNFSLNLQLILHLLCRRPFNGNYYQLQTKCEYSNALPNTFAKCLNNYDNSRLKLGSNLHAEKRV